MRRVGLAALLVAGSVALPGAFVRPSVAYAQQSPGVAIVLPARDKLVSDRPGVRTFGIVTASHTAELIRNGFPARLHYKMERWTAGRFVNDVKSTTEWELIVEYDALAKLFRVVRVTSDRAVVVAEHQTLEGAAATLADAYEPPIGLPKRKEKSYYVVSLTVEAMSLSDLDEVRRWLRGELRPAMRGKRNPGTAVSSGIRTLFVRVLGGERLQYQTSTGVFTP